MIRLLKMCTVLNGTLIKRILLITRVNTTLGHIILLYAHDIYTRLIHPWFYQGQADLAL